MVSFKKWWTALKPTNLEDEEEVPDVTALNVAGVNGVISLVVFLLWWGKTASKGGDGHVAVWMQSVEEVAKLLELMNDLAELDDAGDADDADDAPSVKRKYV